MDIFYLSLWKTKVDYSQEMKNIIVRSLSGAVYVGVIISSIVWGGLWAYPLVCAALAAVGIVEFNRICLGTQHSQGNKTILALDITAAVCTILGPIRVISWPAPFTNISAIISLLAFLYLIVRPVAQLYFKEINPIKSLTTSFGGNTYVAIPLLCSCLIQQISSPGLLLALFIMIWCNDTGAFLSGISLGKHKLWERISPKKTWEGFIGGMIFCTASAVACAYLFDGPIAFKHPMPLWNIITLGITVSIVATWGDLVESLLKRSANIKDSGNIIPGHGGVLDRIDSLLLVMPWALLWLTVASF